MSDQEDNKPKEELENEPKESLGTRVKRFVRRRWPYILAGAAVAGGGAYLLYRNSQKVIPIRAHHLYGAVTHLLDNKDFNGFAKDYEKSQKIAADILLEQSRNGLVNLNGVDLKDITVYPQGTGRFVENFYADLYRNNSPVKIVNTDDPICNRCRRLTDTPPCVVSKGITFSFGDEQIKPEITPDYERMNAEALGVQIGKTYRFRDLVDRLAENGRELEKSVMKTMRGYN